ncbi:homocysteine S-methyltransferase family protein [Roseobacteraceae bacterium S113]
MTEITLLDGGMGQELIRRSGKPAAPLWGLQVMLDHPGLVSEVHRDYAAAGATVATTNTYAIHRDRLRGASNHYAAKGAGLPDREGAFADLLHAAMTEAAPVRGTGPGKGRVAGSIGPLGGSYKAELHPDSETAQNLFAECVRLIAPHADIILFETVASIAAARDALAAARAETDKPVWLAFTVDDEDGALLRSGEYVADAVAVAKDADAMLANCSIPEVMPRALDAMAATGKPIGAYGNAFTMITKDFIEGATTADGLSAREDMVPETYARHALSWLDHGATILGGCCETGPAHIAEIANQLKANGHSIV